MPIRTGAPGAPSSAAGGSSRQRSGLTRHRKHRVEIDLRGDERRDRGDMRARRVGLVARDKAQVALDDRHPVVALDGAQHRDAGVVLR